MNTKTTLIILGVIVVIVAIIVVSKSKKVDVNEDQNNGMSVDGQNTTQTPSPTQEGQPVATDPTMPPSNPENPAFPTTGFEPTN